MYPTMNEKMRPRVHENSTCMHGFTCSEESIFPLVDFIVVLRKAWRTCRHADTMIKQYLKYYKPQLRIGTWTNDRNETYSARYNRRRASGKVPHCRREGFRYVRWSYTTGSAGHHSKQHKYALHRLLENCTRRQSHVHRSWKILTSLVGCVYL